MKLEKSKDKEKILKAVRDKRVLTYIGRNIRLIAGLSTETWRPERDGSQGDGYLGFGNIRLEGFASVA